MSPEDRLEREQRIAERRANRRQRKRGLTSQNKEKKQQIREQVQQEIQQEKRAKKKKGGGVPTFLKKVKNFTVAAAKHVLNGMDTVPEQELQRRFSICKRCENFKKKRDYYVCSAEPNMSGCGCRLSNNSEKYINKLLWSISECPDKPPRWGPYKKDGDKIE